ncbi:LTA synthase family protein, partial [Bacteroides heparinolyticus]
PALRRRQTRERTSYRRYAVLSGIAIVLFAATTLLKGGFSAAYKAVRQDAYMCASTTSMYTVFGDMCHDLMSRKQTLTPETRQQIEAWLSRKPVHRALPDSIGTRNNCIVILAESLESWVLETEVEGQEITPCLNRLIKDSTTLYAPRVLTQVKGGRSIDAQLMLCAGLLPIESGTYSSLYPDHTYHTLQKAMHRKKASRNYLLTIDKVSTWNQGVIAYSFGTDTIIAYHDFKLEEAFGTHKRTGDGAFLAQCRRKIENGEIWKKGENVYMQLVTYSGHAPFKLPEELKEVRFSPAIPQKMNDYMTTARYTDKAIGRFVEYLKTLPQYAETLIVITGDHEGLASHREELCNAPGGKGVVSDKTFTPFIVVNSPVGMRYDKVMGQIDMYPTLLNLLRLDDYCWSGLGQSIFDPSKKGFAVSPQLKVEGESVTPQEAAYAQEAYEISDRMIQFDYLGRYAGE